MEPSLIVAIGSFLLSFANIMKFKKRHVTAIFGTVSVIAGIVYFTSGDQKEPATRSVTASGNNSPAVNQTVDASRGSTVNQAGGNLINAPGSTFYVNEGRDQGKGTETAKREVDIKGMFEEIQKTNGVFVTRVFSILKETGAKFTIGDYPGTNGIQFELGKLSTDDGVLVQEFILRSERFKLQKDERGRHRLPSAFSSSGAGLVIDTWGIDEPRLRFGIHRNSKCTLYTPEYDLSFTVLDVDASSLKLKLEGRQSTRRGLTAPEWGAGDSRR